jgi:hypothetical protein
VLTTILTEELTWEWCLVILTKKEFQKLLVINFLPTITCFLTKDNVAFAEHILTKAKSIAHILNFIITMPV